MTPSDRAGEHPEEPAEAVIDLMAALKESLRGGDAEAINRAAARGGEQRAGAAPREAARAIYDSANTKYSEAARRWVQGDGSDDYRPSREDFFVAEIAAALGGAWWWCSDCECQHPFPGQCPLFIPPRIT